MGDLAAERMSAKTRQQATLPDDISHQVGPSLERLARVAAGSSQSTRETPRPLRAG